jgi:hypothetical protein
MKEKRFDKPFHASNDGVSRREFIGTTLAGSAALFAGGLTALAPRSTSAITESWIEATIPELQVLMNSGALTSEQLTTNYLTQIASLNPLLHAVIETNPDALAIAEELDTERQSGHLRGPLHGIPVLVKDNLATADKMQTTAGSLALVGSTVPADSVVVNRLRAAGAVILGKANLSEWANFRGNAPFNGWSARGGALDGGGPAKGFTRDPISAQLRSVRIELRVGRGVRGESLRDRGRHGDGRFYCLPFRQQSGLWSQADRGIGFSGRNHSDRAQSGYSRSDVPERHRRSHHARRDAIAVWPRERAIGA